MGNNFLLTYENSEKVSTFAWFEYEEELLEFIETKGDKIKVLEMIEILDSRDLKSN